ncbi:hypothetical protein PV371_16235 [Streptomyces sp. TX20-6-3]|uniref:hypothetical protein n=1 Tax=Streptomyces sp. TX20-6-3 TaxID=3028705 RepID=UPI0029B73E71|nr:hypothetical protein [Streptomyces sp. TX20-6-3]MDX2561200.1 hypothetical protein [Streptomyces sp. TX20-6-3]
MPFAAEPLGALDREQRETLGRVSARVADEPWPTDATPQGPGSRVRVNSHPPGRHAT